MIHNKNKNNPETHTQEIAIEFEDSIEDLFYECFVILRKKWRNILLCTLLGLTFGTFFSLSFPKQYEAECVILPVSGRTSSGMDFKAFGTSTILEIINTGKIPEANSLNKSLISTHLSSYKLHNEVLIENNLSNKLIPYSDNMNKEIIHHKATYLLMEFFRLSKASAEKIDADMYIRRLHSDALKINFRWDSPEDAAAILVSYIDRLHKNLKEKEIKRLSSIKSYLMNALPTFDDETKKDRLNNLILSLQEQMAFVQTSPNCFFDVVDPVFPKYKPIRETTYLFVFLFTILIFFMSLFSFYFKSKREKYNSWIKDKKS